MYGESIASRLRTVPVSTFFTIFLTNRRSRDNYRVLDLPMSLSPHHGIDISIAYAAEPRNIVSELCLCTKVNMTIRNERSPDGDDDVVNEF